MKTTRRKLLATGSATALFSGAVSFGGRKEDSEAEVASRANHYVRQEYLVVDYYRIRRRVAYPLPVSSLSLPAIPVVGINDYPWATWMLWELEERVASLGWAAEWWSKKDCIQAVTRDLEALSEWPQYCQYRQPDLSSAHAGRVLWCALTRWRWPNAQLRSKMQVACARHVNEVMPLSDSYFGPIRSKADLLSRPEPYKKLPNIPVIGTIAAALTASAGGHPAAVELNRRVTAIFEAILALRSAAMTEAVGYDGYVLDFLSDWLSIQQPSARNVFLKDRSFGEYLDESYMLSVPGAVPDVAELSDVEPREMPFHFSAQAKLSAWDQTPVRQWFLRQWPARRIRSDALGVLRDKLEDRQAAEPAAGAMNAHYAVVLRTGWRDEDLAVAISCTKSPMAHVQNDNGTLVIGTRQRWMISDPGYQQYVEGVEREFTLGPAAHNYPVVNGLTQSKKQPTLIALGSEGDRLRTKLDLSNCYLAEAGVRSIVRTVWLEGRELVVVADEIETANAAAVAYHWHGHPEAAWWAEKGWMLLHLPDADLWFTSPQAPLSAKHIVRHAGSRGQLTATAEISPAPRVVWWIFSIGRTAPQLVEEGAGRVQIAGRRFQV
jgi:Heparinase II/III-like protein